LVISLLPTPEQYSDQLRIFIFPSFFARDDDAAREFANGVQIGMVAISEGVRFYTQLKAMTARWSPGIRAGAEHVMPTMG
jgi:hypothetical protein